MKLAYFDCVAGVSGNMLLGSLVDAGLGLDTLQQGLARLHLSGYRIEARKVQKRGLAATFVQVHVQDDSTERHLSEILEVIAAADLPPRVRESATSIFRRLAEAEARVHGTSVEEVHFHEVGGLDAIVDIVGSVLGLHLLGVEGVLASALHVGTGSVRCAHGLLPVPAPATLELLKGVPTYGRDIEAELVTPTGAAILTTLAEGFGAAPPLRVEQVGYGAGSRDLPFPNLLRVSIGATDGEAEGYEEDVVIVVETNIDDMNPEWYEQAMTRLFDAGALDVFLTPIQMKRSRPASQLTVIAPHGAVDKVLAALFAETTTIGVRLHSEQRRKLPRRIETVQTAYGRVGVKLAHYLGQVVNISPEHRDCQRIADERGVPLKEVYQAALSAARRQLGMG
jgi:uncharacterized protein (TIGR00299 family) protein